MATLAVSEGAARLLSFVFYILAARALQPSGFGVVQYTIVLGTLALGALQVLATVLNRELGAARGDEVRIGEVLGSASAVALGLWVASAAVCVVLSTAGLVKGIDLTGLVIVLTGFAAFQLYYAVCRGLGDNRRGGITYVGASFAQLAAFALLTAAWNPGPLVTLLVFGCSSLVPIVVYEAVRPIVLGRNLVLRAKWLRPLWALGAPLLAAQVFYLVWNSADQIWVQRTLGTHEIGIYGAAKNLSQIFVVLPAGILGVVMPRVAELRGAGDDDSARRLALFSTGLATAASLVLAVPVILLRGPLLGLIYGSSYRSGASSLFGLSVAMVLFASFAAITTAAIGWGRPAVYLWGIGIAAIAEPCSLAVAHGHTPQTAAWAYAASMGLGLAAVGAWFYAGPLGLRRTARSAQVDAP